jgi:hypothetical protein
MGESVMCTQLATRGTVKKKLATRGGGDIFQQSLKAWDVGSMNAANIFY